VTKLPDVEWKERPRYASECVCIRGARNVGGGGGGGGDVAWERKLSKIEIRDARLYKWKQKRTCTGSDRLVGELASVQVLVAAMVMMVMATIAR
jgi:hypothetical protein